MDTVILTNRLKLVLLTKVETESAEFASLYKLYTDDKATFWSIHARPTNEEEMEKATKRILPNDEGETKTYRVVYAVHRFLEPSNEAIEAQAQDQDTKRDNYLTEFIGLVNLKSMEPGSLPLPENPAMPDMFASGILTIEVAYMFLPQSWGKGYAGEAISAMLEACKKARSFWDPYSKVYVRALVNTENPRSLRVMDKIGMSKIFVYHWVGKPGERFFIGGRWRETDNLSIHGMYVLE